MTETVSDPKAFDVERFLQDDSKLPSRTPTPPQNTDGEAVAWRVVGDDGAYLVYREEKDARDALGRIHSRTLHLDRIEALVPASLLSTLKAERDALIASTGEHITKRSEYLARAEAAEAERDTLAKLVSEFLAFNDEGPGLIDCIDNDGERYTSMGLDQTIKRARSTLKGDAP